MKLLLTTLLAFSTLFLFAQKSSSEEIAVIQTIQKMFDGMRAGDSSAVNSVFMQNAAMATVFYNKEGKSQRRAGDLEKFVTAVGTPHDEIWDEKIWSYRVEVDANLASAWTDYTFYAGDKLSHCGVNAFHLFKSDEGWKITNITDTRRRENCQTEMENPTTAIDTLMNRWHRAAATGDEEVFFGSMTADGIYIGTDASELWLRDELKEWSKKYFERDSAWSFTPTERNIYFAKDGQTAWFDELLDTWMGACRSSGIVTKTAEGWKIQHYHLSIAVPNDVVQDYLKLLKN
ncbi:MAG: nuclear transport factor 2 family protein [Saprospiraceae bacterium]